MTMRLPYNAISTNPKQAKHSFSHAAAAAAALLQLSVCSPREVPKVTENVLMTAEIYIRIDRPDDLRLIHASQLLTPYQLIRFYRSRSRQ